MTSHDPKEHLDTQQPNTDSEKAEPVDASVLKTLTPDELRIVEIVAQSRGLKWAIDHLQLILAQAREIGEL